MTVSNTTRKAGPYTGNGVTTSFAFSFKVFVKQDISVVLTNTTTGVSTTLVLDSDYSVSVNANQDVSPGGTITYPISGSPLPATSTLTVIGNMAYSQGTQLPAGGAYNAQNVEDALDRVTILTQQLVESFARALSLPVGSTASSALPTPSANKLLAWDQSAATLVNLDPTTVLTVAGSSGFITQTFSGTGAQTAFTLTDNPGAIANLEVYVSGVRQTPTAGYTVSGTTLTFVAAPAAGSSNILVRWGQTYGLNVPAAGSVLPTMLSTGGIYWDVSGNVGIGTTSPSALLHLNKGSGTADIRFSVANTLYAALQSSASSTTLATVTSAPLLLGTNNLERIRIDSSGFVGVNTTPPSAISLTRLYVGGDVTRVGGSGAFAFNAYYDINDARWEYAATSQAAAWVDVGSGNYAFSSTGATSGAVGTAATMTERFRVTSGGEFIIGSSANNAFAAGPGHKFHANGQSGQVLNSAAALNTYHLYNENATNNGYRFYLSLNGGISNYSANNTNLSDERVKKDIAPAGEYLAKICAIPVRVFRYKDQADDALNLGVIAQEVEAVAPELVSNDGFGETPEDGVPLKTIYQTDLQYALLKAIQELKAELDAAKARIAALEA